MRRFEFSDGKSNKFWEITLDGNTYAVRYGKIGTDGQNTTKVFADAAQAAKKAESVIRSKMKKGYAEVAASAPVAKRGSNPELEAAIEADPSDTAAWAVYADWLQSQGDARGDLIAVQIARSGAPEDKALAAREQTLMKVNTRAWMGDFAKEDWAACSEFTWHNGFWRSAKVFKDWENEDLEVAKMLGVVLRHDSARFLSELYLGLPDLEGEADFQELIDSVVRHGKRQGLRKLHVGCFEYPDETEISWTEIGSAAKLYSVLPDLEDLTLTGGSIEIGEISTAKLKRLKLETGGLLKEPATQLAKAQMPDLEHLEIWFGNEDYGGECEEADVAAVVANAKGFPAVRYLGLKNCQHSDAIPRMLLDSPWLPQLITLDLALGTLTDEGAEVLLDNAKHFRHLALDLDANYIGDDMAAKLRIKLPQVSIADQEDPEEYGVYVTIGE